MSRLRLRVIAQVTVDNFLRICPRIYRPLADFATVPPDPLPGPFEERGVHTLKGGPGEWQLYAVTRTG